MTPLFKLHLALLVLVLAPAPLVAQQQKVAEGEYQAKSGEGDSHTRHWVLMTKASGGYFVRSEIDSPAEGIRVVQLEALDSRLVPTSVGYELYLKNHAEADVKMRCDFAAN